MRRGLIPPEFSLRYQGRKMSLPQVLKPDGDAARWTSSQPESVPRVNYRLPRSRIKNTEVCPADAGTATRNLWNQERRTNHEAHGILHLRSDGAPALSGDLRLAGRVCRQSACATLDRFSHLRFR